MVYGSLDSYQKSGKTNDPISRKVKKPHFWATPGPNWPTNFFSKIALFQIQKSIDLYLFEKKN